MLEGYRSLGRAESRPVNDDIDLQEVPFAMPQAEQCL